MEAARSGDVQQAVEILSREIAHERSGRARFQRKIQLAQICMSTGHEAIAYPILNEMADEIEHRKLEEWEASEVLAHPLALLFRCMNQLDGDAETKRKLYARICRLDPVQALACSK
jgi:type VI secretion system protein ImpA